MPLSRRAFVPVKYRNSAVGAASSMPAIRAAPKVVRSAATWQLMREETKLLNTERRAIRFTV